MTKYKVTLQSNQGKSSFLVNDCDICKSRITHSKRRYQIIGEQIREHLNTKRNYNVMTYIGWVCSKRCAEMSILQKI